MRLYFLAVGFFIFTISLFGIVVPFLVSQSITLLVWLGILLIFLYIPIAYKTYTYFKNKINQYLDNLTEKD